MRKCFWLVTAVVLFMVLAAPAVTLAQGRARTSPDGPESEFSTLVGSPTDRAVVISVLSAKAAQGRIEYGTWAADLNRRTEPFALVSGVPLHVDIAGLSPNTQYAYRVALRAAGDADWRPQASGSFRTARPTGQAFTFTVQGDSHPERIGRMYDPDLYTRALINVAADKPDFHFLMGDDFSIERIIESGPPQGDRTRDAVNAVYASQRSFLGIVGKSTPLMLVNGNHEQAAKYLLDGSANNFAVLAGKARTAYYPLPAPGGIYTGNSKAVEHVGLLRDYYAWEWGDALFVVIDPYWHSDVAVDNEGGKKAPQRDAGRGAGGRGQERGAGQPGENNREAKRRARVNDAGGDQAEQPANRQGKGNRDLWQITLGDDQYAWLHATLTQSKAKFKFVFSHHVSGTGRGGVEVAPYYEWGGQDRRGGGGGGGGGRNRQGAAEDAQPEQQPAPAQRGVARFFQARPMWEKPIHDLMRDAGVTIFFQGHDHLYARQELDGVIYQSCPNPADPTFTAFNREAYQSGNIFANSGHLRITVNAPDAKDASSRSDDAPTCKVEYIRAARPGDEAEHGKNGSIVHSYIVKPRAAKPTTDGAGAGSK